MNIILYVMDALRADFLGCYGFEKETSPKIDQFARDGVRFSNAYATTTWTKASAASIVTSQYPRAVDMMHQSDRMPNVNWSMGRTFSEAGFKTNAVSANLFFSPEYGFDDFDNFDALQQDEDIVKRHREAKSLDTLDAEITQRLEQDKLVVPHSEYLNERLLPLLSTDEDTLNVAWSIDTHGPYYPRDGSSKFGNHADDFILESEVDSGNVEKVKAIYADMIRYNDRTFGNLLEELKRRGIYEESLIILTADHGESFGDHRSEFHRPIVGHTGPVYDEVIHVPLIIKFPANEYAGTVSDAVVQLTDVYPTMATVGEVPLGGDNIVGESLYPLPDASKDRIAFAETQITSDSYYSAAVRRGRFKLLLRNRVTNWGRKPKQLLKSAYATINPKSTYLFDMEDDPDETRDVKAENKQVARELRNAYETIVTDSGRRAERFDVREDGPVSEETKAHLEALGYYDE